MAAILFAVLSFLKHKKNAGFTTRVLLATAFGIILGIAFKGHTDYVGAAGSIWSNAITALVVLLALGLFHRAVCDSVHTFLYASLALICVRIATAQHPSENGSIQHALRKWLSWILCLALLIGGSRQLPFPWKLHL